MAVKIRLARRGRKKLAMYDLVVADARAPRDGRFIEKLGTYNPNTNPASIVLNDDKALDWVLKGAQPTDTVRAMLSYRGIMLKKHLQIGVNKGALTQEEADAKFNEWKESKDKKISTKVEGITSKKEAERKARLEAERKIRETRAAELKKAEEAAAAEAAPEEETAENNETAEAQAEENVTAEASADEAGTEETQPEEPKAETEEEPKAEAEAVEEKKED